MELVFFGERLTIPLVPGVLGYPEELASFRAACRMA